MHKSKPKKAKKKKAKKALIPKIKINHLGRKIAISFFVLTIIIGAAGVFYIWIVKDLPDPNKLLSQTPPLTTKLYDRSGQLLYKIYRDQNRSLVTLDKIPPYLINATVAVEDKKFFEHNGFSIEGIIRALKRNLLNQQMEGGSTITQQLIKNTLLTPEKTIKRKLKELVLAFQAELIFSKNEILEMYLNTVPYGGTAYGVQEAAQTYFDKNVEDLSLAEAALLTGLPAAPSKYSPFGSNPELSIVRQHEVLRRMVENNYITPFEAEKAKSEKIYLAPLRNSIQAPHFVMYLKDWLTDNFGVLEVEQGGLNVISSLDLDIQYMAEKALKEELEKLKNMNVNNGAVLVLNPHTGEILAMVGSKDYFNQSVDGNVNVALQLRQPGSTIKLINYTYALENGYTAASIISDTPISYQIPGQAPYTPINYDLRWHGNVTLRQAFASSFNVPAVKVLASFGVDKMLSQGEKMGINTWQDKSRYGLSLTLGGGDVKMIELAKAYAIIANQGKDLTLFPVLAVKDQNRKTLLENNCYDGFVQKQSILACEAKEKNPVQKCEQAQIVNPGVAYIISSILSDNQARTPAFGPNSLLNIDKQTVAVKTGTTNDKRDNWCIGYSADYLVAVWVGNNDNQPMSAVASGITGATPIWHNIMTELFQNKAKKDFPLPGNIKEIEICPINGLLACDACSGKKEYFLSGTEPKYHCSSQQIQALQEEMQKQQQDQILQGISTAN